MLFSPSNRIFCASSETDWSEIYWTSDTLKAFDQFHNYFMALYIRLILLGFVDPRWPRVFVVPTSVLSWYSIPNDATQFEQRHLANSILWHVSLHNELSYLLDDYVINLLNCERHAPARHFRDVITSNGLLPIITRPTTVTPSSATRIKI